MQKKFFLLTALILLILASLILVRHKKDTREEFSLWTIQLKPVAQSVIEKNIEIFEKQHPDIKVVWVDIPIAEAQKRTLAAILGGNPPDLINLNPDFSVILAQIGALEYFDEDEAAKFHPSVVNMLKYQGKIFALPYYATSSVTLYNKNIYNSCGYDKAPATYFELAKIAPDLKRCSGIYPLSINLNENDSLAKILNKYQISGFDNDIDIEKTTEVFSLFNDLYKNNLISKDTLTINHREMAEKYMSNNALFVVLGSNFLNMVKENAPSIYEKSDISPQLIAQGGKYDVSLMNFIIPKRARHKQLAKEFTDMLTQKDSQVELGKLTNVIPVNLSALEDDYFKNCTSDLNAKARCVSIEQLAHSGNKNFGEQNKKAINDMINKSIETVLLDESITNEAQIETEVRKLADEINTLKKN